MIKQKLTTSLHMQVIPFLVLAVGVDNMFILAHALQQQDPSLPIPERLGRALAGAGPSITLAAACETLAFGLGGLTSMPAVRNFSLCAAVAVLLDYALQVSVALFCTAGSAVHWRLLPLPLAVLYVFLHLTLLHLGSTAFLDTEAFVYLACNLALKTHVHVCAADDRLCS